MNRLAGLTVSICVLAAFTSEGALGAPNGDHWPTWRGPNRMGISPKGNPPLTWSETENIKWKIKLTGDRSNSSPVIWGNKIFIQTAVQTDVKVRIRNTTDRDVNYYRYGLSGERHFLGWMSPGYYGEYTFPSLGQWTIEFCYRDPDGYDLRCRQKRIDVTRSEQEFTVP